MEIIADMNNGKKMITATDHELAMILGFENTYDTKFSTNQIRVGNTIDVAKFKKVSHYVRNTNVMQLRSVLSNLKSSQTELEKSIDLVEEMQVFDKLKDE